jgi:hypothetical protein
MPDLIEVRVRDCACPGTPHPDEGDLVYLLPMLGLDGGILAEQQMLTALPEGANAGLARRWLHTFVEYGAVGWNLIDEDGPVPFDVATLLADWRLARPVADRASDLYADAVMAPFQQASPKSSRTGQTRRGTSRTREPISESPA